MRALFAALSFIAVTVPVGANHCEGYSTSSTAVDTGVAPGLPQYYLANDAFCNDFCSFWGYEESNGLEGLQRGDEVVDDTCHGMIAPDTIII